MDRIGKFLGIKNSVTTVIIVVALTISMLSAVLSMVVRAPITGMDEQSHYARSIQLATGQIKVTEHGDLSRVGGYISESQREFILKNLTHDDKNKAISLNWYKQNSNLDFSKVGVFYTNTNSAPYSPFSYIPYIAAAKFSQWLSIKPIDEYIGMRVFGFLFYMLLLILAIKVTPIGKVTLSFISLIPTVIFSLTSISADGYLITISAMFFAIIFRLYNKILNGFGVSLNDALLLAIISIFLVMGKVPIFLFMGLLCPLIVFLFFNRANYRKQSYFLLMILIFSIIITLGWLLIVKDINTGAYFGRDVDTFKQLNYISSHFSKFIKMLISTILRYKYIVYQIGYTNLSDVTTINHFSSIFVPVSLILSVLIKDNTTIVKRSNLKFVVGFEITKYLLICFYVIAVFVMLFLQYSLIGSDKIEGVQPRYFIPLYFPLFGLPFRIDKLKNSIAVIVLGFALIPTLSYIHLLIGQL